MTVTVAAFYKFVHLDDPEILRARLGASMTARDMKGTVLLAREGINGTVSAAPEQMMAFLAEVRADPRFADLITKEAPSDDHPFKRLKVKIKPAILTFRHPGADPATRVGTYVKPAAWNALVSDPDVVLLDTRNAYEVAAGTFRGALDPKTRNFGELADFVREHLDPARHKRISMFCTGGIRCEKASAYLLSQGFAEVYHLEGGILKYLAEVPPEESLFDGGCFVFDERGAVVGN